MASPSSLVVWMNGLRVGTWEWSRSGVSTFGYDETWMTSPEGRVLSLSLPFDRAGTYYRGNKVTWFFDNLLPDSKAIRNRLGARFSADPNSTFDLLAAIGRDCVGAVQLLPEGERPEGYDRIDAKPLDEVSVESLINASLSDGRVLGQKDEGDDFRISIAGAQEKTCLLFHRNRWCQPLGSTPTTHILKMPLGLVGNLQADMRDSVENEWLCSKLMTAFGLDAASCEIAQFGARKVLVVERFDRLWQGKSWIARLPQEDFCQALGRSGLNKYEAEGGPGMRDIFRVLDAGSHPLEDKRAFVKAQIVFWLMAATDGHAKNFSIFHQRGGTHRLTPFYDVLSAWPIIGPKTGQLPWQKARMAMAVRNGDARWKFREIHPHHWDVVARQAGLGDASALIHETAGQFSQVLEEVGRAVPKGFPAYVRDAIFTGIEKQAKVLNAGG